MVWESWDLNMRKICKLLWEITNFANHLDLHTEFEGIKSRKISEKDKVRLFLFGDFCSKFWIEKKKKENDVWAQDFVYQEQG